jgi:hypothetical protein
MVEFIQQGTTITSEVYCGALKKLHRPLLSALIPVVTILICKLSAYVFFVHNIFFSHCLFC